jgi:hypothetical protein
MLYAEVSHPIVVPITGELKVSVAIAIALNLVEMLVGHEHNVLGQIHNRRIRKEMYKVNPVRT